MERLDGANHTVTHVFRYPFETDEIIINPQQPYDSHTIKLEIFGCPSLSNHTKGKVNN